MKNPITTRALCGLALLLFTWTGAQHCFAQLQPLGYKLPEPSAEESGALVWEIHPALEPKPALKYRFFPDRIEMVPGNTFVYFQRAMLLLFEDRSYWNDSEFEKNYERWISNNLSDFPAGEVKQYLETINPVMDEMHRAENLRDSNYDLGIDELRGPEVVEFLLPEFQNMRVLARRLQLETRLALAEGRVDDAIQSLRVGFRLSDSVGGAADLLVSRLVGIAIAGLMLGQVEAGVQLEQMPNMYWALASLPDSIYDMEPASKFEATILERIFPALAKLPSEQVDPQAWRDRLTTAFDHLRNVGLWSEDAPPLLTSAAILAFSESSREQLINSGIETEVVAKMTAAEAVIRSASIEIKEVQDDYSKWLLLPNSMKVSYMDRMGDAFEQQMFSAGPRSIAIVMAGLLMPGINSANAVQQRTEQQIARLATVEAIRDYAARNQMLPRKLDDLTVLPAWPDPKTGELFDYKRISDTEATLSMAPRWSGDKENEITLRLIQ